PRGTTKHVEPERATATTMRPVILALALLVAPTLVVVAQVPPPLVLTIDPLPTIEPLHAPAMANWTLNVSCALIEPPQPSPSGRVTVPKQPPWAQAVVSP